MVRSRRASRAGALGGSATDAKPGGCRSLGLIGHLRALGGRLNPRKCKAWTPGTPKPDGLPEGFWQNEGLLLLGAPHGEGPSRGEDAPLPLGEAEVGRHLRKTLEAYRGLLA